MKCKFLLIMMAGLLLGQTASAQSVFSPSVNGVRSNYQSRRAASPDAQNDRIGVVVTCSVEASAAAIANQMIELGAVIRVLMGNQLVVDLPMSKLDAAAAIEGVLLIDMPSKGQNRTDTARKASHVDEAHAGKMAGEYNLPQAYTGKGVIIGLIDDGYDYTHPMFKDADGKLRIIGVYQPWAEHQSQKKHSIPLKDIPIVDEKGVSTVINPSGSFYTDPDVILDTTIVKDTEGSHGTHCASIAAGRKMEYTSTFQGKYATSGQVGGMAPEASIILTESGTSEGEEELFPNWDKGTISNYNDLQALWTMKHYADEKGMPLVVSWSQNGQDGFHDGTSTMARYIGGYCKPGNVMALCSSNEGGDSMYIARKINKGKSVKVSCWNATYKPKAHFFIRTDKEIQVKLAFVDIKDNVVKDCGDKVMLSSKGTADYQRNFTCGITFDQSMDSHPVYNDEHYKDICTELKKFIKKGKMSLSINEGTGLDKNNKQFTYVHITLNYYDFHTYDYNNPLNDTEYYPQLTITSPDSDVELQAWSENFNLYASSMDSDILDIGTAAHSMGDMNTSGEPVTIGAYATDVNNIVIDDNGKKTLSNYESQKVGRYASFSSFGTDFSDEHRAYPDVSAPGVTIYAAGNSFDPDITNAMYASYTGQLKGQKGERKYPYVTYSGTSMSTPAAAGVIALWMQAAKENGRTLTNKDVKDIIRHSSTIDDSTKVNPIRYGAGKINAYKGLIYILGIKTTIPELPTRHIGATLNGHTLHISGDLDIRVTLYNLSGQKVLDTQAQSGIVELPALPAGVYVVKMGNQGSTLIRL